MQVEQIPALCEVMVGNGSEFEWHFAMLWKQFKNIKSWRLAKIYNQTISECIHQVFSVMLSASRVGDKDV